MQELTTPLSRRYLKSFACGTANMFSCSAQHYAWLACHFGIPRVTIDLLTLTIEPAEFDIKRNRILAEMCRDSLLRNALRLKPPGAVTAAQLVAEFGIGEQVVAEHGYKYVGRSTFTVTVTDDRGKQWLGTAARTEMLADGSGFGDPSR